MKSKLMVKVIKPPRDEGSLWTRSLKSQTGRDTGKVISNLIWGDKHASVYRRAENRKSKALELKERQIEEEQRFREKQLDIEKARQKHEQLMALKNDVERKIQRLSEFKTSENREDLINELSHLSILMKANPFKDSNDKENKISNSYTDAILARYEQTFAFYSSQFPEDNMIGYYADISKSTKKFRFFKKNKVTLFGVSFILLLISIFLILGLSGQI